MTNPFRCFNSSPENIGLAVMMYLRFTLSLRQIKDLLFERGIDVGQKSVRFWQICFGPMFAVELRKGRIHQRSYSLWRWHVDEAFVRIGVERHYLWRAVDHEGEVIEAFASKTSDRKAALALMRRAMKRYGSPMITIMDGLASYSAALKALGIKLRQLCGRWLNNRAENSRQVFRRREGAIARFRDIKTLKRFAAVQSAFGNISTSNVTWSADAS